MSEKHETARRFGCSNVATFDAGPGKYRIGLLALSNDYVTERDFMNMRPDDDVVIYTSRLLNAPDCSLTSLRDMAPRITDAASLLVPEGRLDAIAYSCTSGTAAMGYERVQELVQAGRPGVAFSTPLTASLAGLGRFSAQRVAVLTPYTDEVNEVIATNIESSGLEISEFNSFNLSDNELMAKITPESILQAAREINTSDADALFISCTAIRAVEVIEMIEEHIRKPVITAVQSLFWQSVRLAGYKKPIPGYGKLLRLTS
ncbi:maleate cis-trans isomerase family protein [Mesorhizobium sp. BHbsci]